MHAIALLALMQGIMDRASEAVELLVNANYSVLYPLCVTQPSLHAHIRARGSAEHPKSNLSLLRK